MNRKQKIIVSITGIFIILLILVGLTYAYFLTRINGNTNTKSISATTANLALTYGDGNGIINAEKIRPGDVIGTKTFTVTNTGDATTSYGVFLEDVINQLVRTDDLQIEMTCTSSIQNNTCNGYNNVMPHQNDILVSNDIEEGEIQTYSLTLTYIEAGVDQSDDMNKEVSAKVQIYDLNNTVDLQGIITDYNPGDYVVVHSTPKESQIRSDGTYKVVGLEPGNHTVEVYNSSNTKKYNKTLTITKGETDNISGTTVTVTDTTRTVMTSVSSSGLSVTELKNQNTFANTIINNAKNVTAEQKTLLYAEYSETPKTQPAAEISGENESTLSKTQDDYGDSYYFRGNVANNYVDFAGYCWRVVRIQGDGSVKLVLASRDGVCENSSNLTDRSAIIGAGDYGFTISNSKNYADYENSANRTTSQKYQMNAFLNGGNFDYSYIIDRDKYNNTVTYPGFTSSDKELIKDEQTCIGDMTNKYTSTGTVYTSGNTWYYDNYKRLAVSGMYAPSLECNGTKTVSSKIYPLTADEIVFAGGKYNTSNSNYYLKQNTTGIYGWWSLSPNNFNYVDYAFDVNSGGGVYSEYVSSTNEYDGFRPVVSIKTSSQIINGDGSQTNPYKLTNTEAESYIETTEVTRVSSSG